MQLDSRLRPPGPMALVALAAVALGAHAATTWHAAAPSSRLGFTGTQAGAHFDGVFGRFESTVQFDPADLAASRIEVTIDMASVDTEDEDRDGILRGPDLFAVERFPEAHYVATQFEADAAGDGFVGNGTLTVRDVTHAVPIRFTFDRSGDHPHLVGAAELRRLDFGVGQGEWQDTQWVANEVKVHFDLALESPPTAGT
jgi:polyisoprenoid-binding protein YceI